MLSSTSDQKVKSSGAGEKGSDSDSQSDSVTHCITMGDTYKRLALRYHTKPCMIKKRNKISKPLKYMIGRELIIRVGKSYTPRDQQAAVQESLFPALMKAFMLKAEDSEVNETPSYFKGKKYEKARQKMCIAGAAPSRPAKRKVAGSRMQKQFHNQTQIELGPIIHTARDLVKSRGHVCKSSFTIRPRLNWARSSTPLGIAERMSPFFDVGTVIWNPSATEDFFVLDSENIF